MGKFKIACHLIQWAGEEKKNLEKVLGEVAKAGYEGVEGISIEGPEDLVAKATLAAKYGLHIVNAGCKDSPVDAIKFNIAFGNRAAEVPVLRRDQYGGQEPSDADFEKAARTLDEVLSFCEEHHIKGFHHAHLRTMIESQEDAQRLLRAAPKLWLLFDTGHLQAAKSDPMKVLETLGNRIGWVHLKDFYADNPKTWKWDYKTSKWGETARFCELGRGNGGMDIKKVLEGLESAGYDDWISVELDRTYFIDTPAEAAIFNRQFLKSMGY